MGFRRPRACLALLLLGQLLVAGCRDRAERDRDGGDDATNNDAATAGDALAPLALDFSATGCGDFNLTLNRCTGPAPLTVRLSPIGSPTVNRFLWDFGDGTAPSTERAPTHSYTLPGMYTVSLVGASVTGSLSRVRPQFIAVSAASVGELCDVDAQCATGLRCLCGSSATCGGAFSRGICSIACGAGPCTGGAVCADLALGLLSDDPPPSPLPFQDVLCLAPCDSDRTCAPGLSCRDLPAGGGGVHAWVRGCFAPLPLDVGASCRNPDGALSGNLCTSGRCAELGALGLCSATCASAGDCPPGAACALFGDGRQLCLRTCAGPTECDGDPLIGCRPSDADGSALSFTLPVGGPTSACGPRACHTTDDCRPSGLCQDGHCRPLLELPARAR
jgi:PKD repeat protein